MEYIIVILFFIAVVYAFAVNPALGLCVFMAVGGGLYYQTKKSRERYRPKPVKAAGSHTGETIFMKFKGNRKRPPMNPCSEFVRMWGNPHKKCCARADECTKDLQELYECYHVKR